MPLSLWPGYHSRSIPLSIYTLSLVSSPAPPVLHSNHSLLSSSSPQIVPSLIYFHLRLTSAPWHPHLNPVFDSFPSTTASILGFVRPQLYPFLASSILGSKYLAPFFLIWPPSSYKQHHLCVVQRRRGKHQIIWPNYLQWEVKYE